MPHLLYYTNILYPSFIPFSLTPLWDSHVPHFTPVLCLLCVQIFENELKDQEREVCFVDIAYDEIPERYYKESEVSSDHLSEDAS